MMNALNDNSRNELSFKHNSLSSVSMFDINGDAKDVKINESILENTDVLPHVTADNSYNDQRRCSLSESSSDGHSIRTYHSNISINDVNESHYYVPIDGYEVIEERSRFTVFRLRVEDLKNDRKWFVFRRFSDFILLNNRLKQLYPKYRFSLPSKRWFRDNFDPLFLEERQLALQLFLNNILTLKSVSNSKEVRDFLRIDDPPQSNVYDHHSLSNSEDTIMRLKKLVEDKDKEIIILRNHIEYLQTQLNNSVSFSPRKVENCDDITIPSVNEQFDANDDANNDINDDINEDINSLGVRASPDGSSNHILTQ